MDYMIDSSIYISVAISIVFYCIYSYLTSNNQVGLLCCPTMILMAFQKVSHKFILKILSYSISRRKNIKPWLKTKEESFKQKSKEYEAD